MVKMLNFAKIWIISLYTFEDILKKVHIFLASEYFDSIGTASEN